MENNFTKHELLMGRLYNGKLEKPLLAGNAFLNEGDPFYSIKLMILPGQTYYLVKNRDSATKYTAYAKLVKKDDGYKFQNPVGSGFLLAEAKYLEIYIPLFRAQLFMSLYPS